MAQLIMSGFCFFAELSDGTVILENRFTGLRILYDERTNTYETLEG